MVFRFSTTERSPKDKSISLFLSSIMTSVISDSWPEWTIFRQEERGELLSKIADLNKEIDRCNEIILAHKPKPATQNAWQSKTILRAKTVAPTRLTPAQERDAALILQRKHEEEQREENRRAQAQGRKPEILYPELGGLQWIQGLGQRAAMEAGLAQNAARMAVSVSEIAAKNPMIIAQKELVVLEDSRKKLTDRLSKVDGDIDLFTRRIKEIEEGDVWSRGGFRGSVPEYIHDAQKRWNVHIDSLLDTSLPLRSNPVFGMITRSWRPGHEPNAEPVQKQFSWDIRYEDEDEDEDEDQDDTESQEEDYLEESDGM